MAERLDEWSEALTRPATFEEHRKALPKLEQLESEQLAPQAVLYARQERLLQRELMERHKRGLTDHPEKTRPELAEPRP